MSLMELFMTYGNPSQTYTDEVVAVFYEHVDDGTFFTEALGELPDEARQDLARLIDDRTSRSLSHQMIGKIVVDQLREYPRAYLQKRYDELEGAIVAYNNRAAISNEADLANDAGDATGSMA